MLKTLKTSLCVLFAVSTVWAQGASSSPDTFRKDLTAIQKALDDSIRSVAGIEFLQPAKATYVDEFGIFVSLEVVLEPTRNPFTSPAAPRPASSPVAERQRLVREKVTQILIQKAAALQSLRSDQTMVVAVHIFNSNPIDNPRLPGQMIFIVKKQDPSRVIVREQ
jgi:hypothetical protein